jgi:hypothetical protein
MEGERYPLLIDSRSVLLVGPSKRALRDAVYRRGRRVRTEETYLALEKRMVYGGSGWLSLVYEDFDFLRSQYIDDSESYLGAVETLEIEYKLDYKKFVSFLASEDMVIYLNREGPDELIYGFDLNEWNLLILGEQNNWMEALQSYDAVVSSPKMKPVIPATEENRIKYRRVR